jgi:hypothetical protein
MAALGNPVLESWNPTASEPTVTNADLLELIRQQAKCIHDNHAALMNATFEKCQSPYCFRARTALEWKRAAREAAKS